MSSRISASTDIGRQTCPRMRLASWFWMTSPQSRSSGQSSWRGGHQVVVVRGGEEELTAAKVRSCPTTSQRPTATCRVAAASNSSVIFEAVPGSQGSGKSINEAGELAGFVALNGLADPSSPYRAFRWTRQRGIQDLGRWAVTSASDVRNKRRGDVVGRRSASTSRSPTSQRLAGGSLRRRSSSATSSRTRPLCFTSFWAGPRSGRKSGHESGPFLHRILAFRGLRQEQQSAWFVVL